MADIKLVRPSAGQTAVIPSAPDARMVLDFSADQVSIERPQGSDSLFFRFDDGAAIELQNFYTQYNKDDIPSFEVDGQLIAGADFFNAFGHNKRAISLEYLPQPIAELAHVPGGNNFCGRHNASATERTSITQYPAHNYASSYPCTRTAIVPLSAHATTVSPALSVRAERSKMPPAGIEVPYSI